MSASSWIATGWLACAWVPTQHYVIEHLPRLDGERLEVGGLDFLPDGALAVSTRRGQVWIYDQPLADDVASIRPRLFAEGLQEGLGLCVVDGVVHVLQRAEISRLLDDDGDGKCDRIQTLTNDWGVSGNYHEFAFGLPRDDAGSMYFSLNVAFGDPWWLGVSPVPYRGWVLRCDRDGNVRPFACGFRSPAGIGLDATKRLLVTDNQGDWMPACALFHVREGRFYGHPASLAWTDEFKPNRRTPSGTDVPDRERDDAAIWIPYDLSRSAGDMASDSSAGKFGPFDGQLFIAEMTNGKVLRAELEEFDGVTQGAVFPFIGGVGSAIRLRFAPDGSLFCGLTDRGWGGQAPGDGIARVRWTGATPFEIRSAHLVPGGFEIAFTRALGEAGLTPQMLKLVQYDYEYWWEYGSPLRNLTPRAIEAVVLSTDRKSAKVRVRSLTAGKIARLRIEGARSADGQALTNGEFAYTVRRLADDPKVIPIAKPYTAPQPRESHQEGRLLLTQDEPLQIWQGQGWARGGVSVDLETSGRLSRNSEEEIDRKAHQPRTLSNAGTGASGDLATRLEFGDVDLSLDFMLPPGGASGLYLMGRYEIELNDDHTERGAVPGPAHCGAIAACATPPVVAQAPLFDAYRGPGEWHGLSVRFRAPRFDVQGHKIENARFLRVMIDDTLMQEELELVGPSVGAPLAGEAPLGPLVLQGRLGQVAIRDLAVQLREPSTPPGRPADGWRPLFDGGSLQGWTEQSGSISGAKAWSVAEGRMLGQGPGRLWSEREVTGPFELRGRCKLGQESEGSIFVRAGGDAVGAPGYELVLNHSGPGREKTGSLRERAPIRTQLLPCDVWFTFALQVTEEALGTRLVVRLNDVVVNEFLDEQRTFAKGAIVLQSVGAKSRIEFKDLELR